MAASCESSLASKARLSGKGSLASNARLATKSKTCLTTETGRSTSCKSSLAAKTG